jgi:hypothetical protein
LAARKRSAGDNRAIISAFASANSATSSTELQN